MRTPVNQLKTNLKSGQVQLGLWLGFGVPTIAEISARAGFDWCLIDAEHKPTNDAMILSQLQAMAAGNAHPVVRVTASEDWMLKRVLDMGVQSLLVPMVDTAEQAASIVQAVRYPPEGRRGVGAGQARATFYGEVNEYITTANDQICLMAQAESRSAVENIDAIAAIDGIDVIFIGPADLSADMGYPGDPNAPEVIEAIEHIVARTLAAGKAVGTITFDLAQLPNILNLGVTFVGIGGDVHAYASAVRTMTNQSQSIIRDWQSSS